jgi:Uma2 family endonuclease
LTPGLLAHPTPCYAYGHLEEKELSTHVEPLVTVADLEAMPDDGNRYETIEGELFLSKAPSVIHQRVFGRLFKEFALYLDVNPIGELLATPGLTFTDVDAVIPDIVLTLNERISQVVTGDRLTAAPDLVVEILSPGPSNLRRDRVAKRQLYGRFGVGEYWILDPQERTVEVYILLGDTLMLSATLTDSDQLTSVLLPGFRCEVKSLF